MSKVFQMPVTPACGLRMEACSKRDFVLMDLVMPCKIRETGGIMAACTKCGANVSEGAAFCSVCGAPLASVTGPGPAGATRSAAGAGLSSNVAGALSYLGLLITGIIFLVIEPYKHDRFVRFHAFQSICYTFIIIVLGIIRNNIVWMGFLSFRFLWAIVNLVGALVSLAVFAYWLFLMYKAYNNERYMIPIIGEFALKQAGKE
jgi:uncharacterized membrane protein